MPGLPGFFDLRILADWSRECQVGDGIDAGGGFPFRTVVLPTEFLA